jgi:MFS family permease
MLHFLAEYKKIEKPILFAITAEFLIQLINASFMTILPIYMMQEGYTDGNYAHFTSYRFLGVLTLALFVGLYIKKRKIKNLFYIAAIGVPFWALNIILAVHFHLNWLIYLSHLCWGACFTFIQIPIFPYILRNAKKESHTAAISLSYATWSFAGIASSLIIATLNGLNQKLFSEFNLLIAISIISFIGIIFVYKINLTEQIPLPETKAKNRFSSFDWGVILKALVPTVIIAVGAGFTIPFISLFFTNVHHMSTAVFSFYNGIAALLVAIGAMLVPYVKRTIGYKIAVPATQSVSVIALVCMATTQYYNHLGIAAGIAVICFLLRQPLMNMAGPMTSELVMNYAGKRNREMISALTSAIWSGGWFFSTGLFKILYDKGYPYVSIFLITAVLYAIGVIWYYLLIIDYDRKEKAGEIES